MPDLAIVARGAAFATLILLSGWALARCLVRRVDTFAIVACGVALTSLTGVLLARLGVFSLGTVAVFDAAASGAAWAVGTLASAAS